MNAEGFFQICICKSVDFVTVTSVTTASNIRDTKYTFYYTCSHFCQLFFSAVIKDFSKNLLNNAKNI